MKFPFEKKEKEILEKQEGTTDKNYGKNPKSRTLKESLDYGIININKPQGPSSHQVTDYVKKILQINKAGHSGTLDPNVTGSLIIALGRSTRVIHNLLKAGKEYVCLMHIHTEQNENEIKQAINSFVTKIEQMPPVRSAVKRRKRQREIYYIKTHEIKNNQDVLFTVGCEAGTYIRKLCHDIGLKLNTKAHMQQLIRTRVGPFDQKTMHSLYELKDAFELYKEGNEKELKKIIMPVETAIEHLPKIWISDHAVDPLCHGTDLAIPGIIKLESHIKENDTVAILTLKDELVATGISKLNSEKIKDLEKGIAIITKKIFMKKDTYQKYSKS
ncbi:RNA-guided pseudouridylation complex pseudouridine synthase subunit Cbf5 [Candidatus Woesearchaeota archaeon]|jgi:H/ACA ribonucleoprotein complex subunit 4|nr:RNA-guided pseudouridylation complex pseudouridine synthase subunit Cbf5 [Candidatus Woesearchaeota archaeon]